MAFRPANAALTARRNQLIAQLRANTGGALARIWQQMPDHSAAAQEDFAAQAAPIVVGGQSKAIDVSVAFLEYLTGVKARLDRQAVLDASTVDLRSPFYVFGEHLAAGDSIEEALAAGQARADELGFDSVQWASRSSGAAFDHSDRVTGWERIPDGAACDWCIEVAGQTYHTADTASFGHNNCGCDIGPLLDDSAASGYEASAALYAANKAASQ